METIWHPTSLSGFSAAATSRCTSEPVPTSTSCGALPSGLESTYAPLAKDEALRDAAARGARNGAGADVAAQPPPAPPGGGDDASLSYTGADAAARITEHAARAIGYLEHAQAALVAVADEPAEAEAPLDGAPVPFRNVFKGQWINVRDRPSTSSSVFG